MVRPRTTPDPHRQGSPSPDTSLRAAALFVPFKHLFMIHRSRPQFVPTDREIGSFSPTFPPPPSRTTWPCSAGEAVGQPPGGEISCVARETSHTTLEGRCCRRQEILENRGTREDMDHVQESYLTNPLTCRWGYRIRAASMNVSRIMAAETRGCLRNVKGR